MPRNHKIIRTTPELVAINAALIAARQAAEIVCDRASLLVLLHAHGGACRYAEFSEQTQLQSRLLSARLSQLTDDGLLVRIPYSRSPLRHAYHLTYMGVGLFEVLALLTTWEQTWSDSSSNQGQVQVVHLDCKGIKTPRHRMTTAHLHCVSCKEKVTARDVNLRVSQTEMAKMPAKSTSTRRSSQDLIIQAGGEENILPQALAVLGDKWSIEVLVCAFFGLRQFGDFGARMGISTNILTNRLTRLVEIGLLRRSGEDEPHRKGVYLLTPKGQDFYSILIAIQNWADSWIDHRLRSPVKLRHMPCQKILEPKLICATCKQAINHFNAKIVFKSKLTKPHLAEYQIF